MSSNILLRLLNLLPLVLVPVLGMLLSAVLVRYSIGWLCRHGFAAEMGGRHIHKRVIPTAGGIGMIAAFFLALAVYCVRQGSMKDSGQIPLIVVPESILFLIGLYDDRRGMRPGAKLFGQTAAALAAWVCGIRFDVFCGWELPDWLSCVVTVVWILAFINAFNLIDGLDGLAAGLAVLGGLCLAAILGLEHRLDLLVLPLTLVGVSLGFLRYNFHPARVFMGDTGSMFLGYMLATIGLMSSNKGNSFFALLAPMMACGVPLIDTALAVWRRTTFKILRQRSWREVLSADRSHLHHRILDARGANQSRAAVTIYLLATVLGCVGLVAGMIGDTLPALAVLLVFLTLALVLRKFAVLEMWNSTQLVFKGLAMPRKSVFINILHPAYDCAVIGAAFAFAIFLYPPHGLETAVRQLVFSVFPLVVLLACTRTYHVYWLRAGIPDHVRLFCCLTLGFLFLLVGYTAAAVFWHVAWSPVVLWAAWLMTVVGILGERVLLLWLQILLPRYYHDSEFNRDCVPTLLYGAGARLPSYQRHAALDWNSRGERVIGIIDNDKALHGQWVSGYRILGGLDRLEAVYRKYAFVKIVVITEKPIRTNLEILRNFCIAHDVVLKFFIVMEADQPIGIREPVREEVSQ